MSATNNDLKVIGKPHPKLDARERVTGRSVYGHDIELPGMLHGAILRTEHPCAKINSIDISKARNLNGVVCVLTADDIDANNISYKRDHPILKKDIVNCIRDELVAIAAESKEIAQKALSLIKVDYEVLDGMYDPVEALKDDAPTNKSLATQRK